MEFLQAYLDKVMRYMTISRRDKLALIERIRPELAEQLEAHSISSYAEAEELLGAPEAMAEELVATIPYKDRVKKTHRRRRLLIAIICGLLATTIITAAVCVHIYHIVPVYYTVELIDETEGTKTSPAQ